MKAVFEICEVDVRRIAEFVYQTVDYAVSEFDATFRPKRRIPSFAKPQGLFLAQNQSEFFGVFVCCHYAV